jgi:hypothetical protein
MFWERRKRLIWVLYLLIHFVGHFPSLYLLLDHTVMFDYLPPACPRLTVDLLYFLQISYLFEMFLFVS